MFGGTLEIRFCKPRSRPNKNGRPPAWRCFARCRLLSPSRANLSLHFSVRRLRCCFLHALSMLCTWFLRGSRRILGIGCPARRPRKEVPLTMKFWVGALVHVPTPPVFVSFEGDLLKSTCTKTRGEPSPQSPGRLKVSKGRSQPQKAADAFLIPYMVLGQPV